MERINVVKEELKMGVKTLLSDEVSNELQILSRIGEGANEHKAITDDVVKLADRLLDFEKLEHDREEAKAKLQFEREKLEQERDEAKAKLKLEREKHELNCKELELKLHQWEDDKKDRLIKNCITVASIVIPLGVTIWGTLKSFEFEKEGTVTTTIGRGFINKLLPKK